jgi:hypothetical protein
MKHHHPPGLPNCNNSTHCWTGRVREFPDTGFLLFLTVRCRAPGLRCVRVWLPGAAGTTRCGRGQTIGRGATEKKSRKIYELWPNG